MIQSKHVPDRYYAVLEDESRIRVNVALIADYSLFTGRELDENELAELKNAAEKMNTKARALRIMGSRNMSRKELTDRLIQKGERAESAEAAVEWLEEIGAVNDEEYAGLIVRHYAAKGYGLGRIRDELHRRGINQELWDEALTELPEMEEQIDRLIWNKLRGKRPEKDENRKISDYLYRRGFSWEEIRSGWLRYEDVIEEM